MEEQGMIYRCPTCEAGMEFAIDDQKLHCQYCGASYEMEEWAKLWNEKNEKKRQEEKARQEREEAERIAAEQAAILAGEKETPSEPDWGRDAFFYDSQLDEDQIKRIHRRHATVKMQIVHCSACGAELASNEVNLTSVCAYCGQAAVIKDRVEDYLQPDYVVPFKITKDVAEGLIREKFQLAKYAPKEAREFKLENLHGIYVPYWLYDIRLSEKMVLNTHAETKISTKDLNMGYLFYKVPADGSTKMPDEAAVWLTPYNLEEAKPFDGAYLSGYCAERYDQGSQEKMATVLNRARNLFQEAFSGKNRRGNGKLLDTHVQGKIEACDYYLFPVWILTFRVRGKLKTIFLNGQNGKVVGTVLSWPKILTSFLIKLLLLAIVFIPLAYLCVKGLSDYVEFMDYELKRSKVNDLQFYPVFFAIMAFAGLIGTLQYRVTKLYQKLRRGEKVTRLRMPENILNGEVTNHE